MSFNVTTKPLGAACAVSSQNILSMFDPAESNALKFCYRKESRIVQWKAGETTGEGNQNRGEDVIPWSE